MELPGLSVKFGMDHSGFDRGASHILNTGQNLGRQMSGIGSMISNAFATAAGFVIAQEGMRAIGAAAGFVKSSVFGMNDSLQQAKIGFTTMLGSAEAADSFLKQMASFAAKTPFEFLDVTTQAQILLAYGFAAQEVIPLLTDVGNVSAAYSAGAQGVESITRALGQMNAATKVHTQDLNQLIAVGVPAWQILADAIGKTTGETQDMVSQGEIASDVFIKAFDEYVAHALWRHDGDQSHTF